MAEALVTVWQVYIHASNEYWTIGAGRDEKYPLSALVTICLNKLNNPHLREQ